MIKVSLIIFCGTIVAGCSSPTLQVRSTPDGADVIYTPKDGVPQKLGQTPVDLDPSKVNGLLQSVGQIQVSKEGFSPQVAMVPNLGSLGGSGKLNFQLTDAELPKICKANASLADEIARGVVEVTSMIQRKRYADAGGVLQSLIVKFPNVSSLYDLKGNIAYLQRDMQQALEAFKQSNTITPNNPVTLRMIDRILALQGGGRQ